MSFLTSSVVPAAEGSVKVKKDNNSNYQIEIKLKRLAEPKRLTPPKKVYIVWMETNDRGIKNIGELKTSGSFLSRELKSSLKTVTPFKPVKIFITAEDQSDIQYPGSQYILSTSTF